MPEPLIQHYFPSGQAGEESERERAVLSPPPFWLHRWWARRPLAASRAIIASLSVDVDDRPDRRFVAEFLRAVRLDGGRSRPAYNYQPDVAWVRRHSRVDDAVLVDLFAGGGNLSLEALRLGFSRVVAVEYNPVAYVVLKATLEYPLKHRARLARDVRRWAEWLVGEARRRLEAYYPPHPRGRPMSYVWVRVYRCPDGKLMPSLANPLLSRDSKVALKLEGFSPDGKPLLSIVKVGGIDEAMRLATIRGETLQCPGGALQARDLVRQYRASMEAWESQGLYGRHPAVLAAVKLEDGSFVEPTREMLEAYRRAEEELRARWYDLLADDLIPVEDIPEGDKTREVLNRGIDRFYKLFNARQLLTHATMVGLIREAYKRMLDEGYEPEYARAVATYLALGHDKVLNYNSAITTWDPRGKGSIRDTFSRHAYMFGDDYGEGDPVSEKKGIISWAFFSSTGMVRAVERLAELLEGAPGSVDVVLGDAADGSLYAGLGGPVYAVADPPYYDNVQYGELSDFFYVWLKRSVGSLYGDAFIWPLTPKEGEIVVNRTRGRDGAWFESRLREAFEAVREAGASRLAVLYAHKSSEGLYAMFEALLGAGWKPVGAWSVASEQPKSQHILGKAAARTMLVLGAVLRLEGGGGCFWDAGLRSRVDRAVREAVARALGLGLGGVDAVMAGIGAAFRVAGDCWPLSRLDGSPVSARDIVDYATRVGVAEMASRTLEAAGADPLSAMYALARLVYEEPDYDDLRRLGYAMGVDHERFIGAFTGKPRKRSGRKVYPVKTLDRLQVSASPGSLVEALALAVRRFLSGGIDAALKTLKDNGFNVDGRLCKYAEYLWHHSSGAEKEALTAILNVCTERVGPRGSPGSKRLDEYLA